MLIVRGGSGIHSLGASAWGGHIFSREVTELYYRSDGSMIWGDFSQSPPEAEAFSLNKQIK